MKIIQAWKKMSSCPVFCLLLMCRSVPYLLRTILIFLPLLHSKVFLLDLFRSFQFFALNDRVLISLVELTLEVRCLNCRLDWNPELFSTSSRASDWQKGIGERRVEQSIAERGCVISFWALCNGWVGVSISSRLRKVPGVVTPSWRVRKNVLQWG